MNDKQVAELFVEQRVLEPSQAEDVLTEVELNGKSVAQAIIDGGYVDQRGFYQTMAEALGTDYIDLTEYEIAQEVLRFVPAGMARLHGALPIDMVGNVLRGALLAGGSPATGQQHGWQRAWPLVSGPGQSPLCGAFQCLLQIAWTSDINRWVLA